MQKRRGEVEGENEGKVKTKIAKKRNKTKRGR